MTVRAISLGAGVQSTALLVLAARREIDYSLAIFANVGDDTENPATLAYLNDHLRPYAFARGIEVVEVRKERRGGTTETLMENLYRRPRSIGIPVRIAPTGSPAMRSCTHDFKIAPVSKELKRRGATPEAPAAVALGISLDEFHRARDSPHPWQVNEYPLIDKRLTREDCIRLIADEGLPIPTKSSCWFCPFSKSHEWRSMARDHPERFARAVELERMLQAKPTAALGGQVYLSSTLQPLERITEQQTLPGLDDDATCDVGGWCHG